MRIKINMFCCLLTIAVISSCARVSEYTIDIRYVPQKHVPQAGSQLQKYSITVTMFTDARTTDNKAVIGERVAGNGRDIVARCAQEEPSAAVAGTLRDFLIRAGYPVTGEIPAWDLQENSINKSWGALVIGGRVEELEVTCNADQPATNYAAKVKLRLVFADSQRGKVLHTTTLESTSALKHFRCTQEGMQEQINSALSLALEKILDNEELDNALREVSSVRDESLPE
jgi:hypothetical protein